MKRRRLGAFGAALAVACSCVLMMSGSAGAAEPGGIALGQAARYGEYAGGTASVIDETVGGGAAYGGSAMITSSKFGLSPAAFFTPGWVTLALGGSTDSVNATTVAHGRAHYVGSFSGSGNTGLFRHVAFLPISFSTADTDLATASAGIASLGPTNGATGTTALTLTSSSPGTAVFDLTESQVSAASTISIHASWRSTIVVNVVGTAGLSLSSQTVTLSGGVRANGVLWNFPSVPSASFSLETWVGTILVPAGTLSMTTNTVVGSVLFGGATASFYMDKVYDALFNGCVQFGGPGDGAPEAPAAIALPGCAVLIFGSMLLAKRRRRKRAMA